MAAVVEARGSDGTSVVLHAWAFSAVVWGVALARGGRRALVVLGVQAVIGFNYVEHSCRRGTRL